MNNQERVSSQYALMHAKCVRCRQGDMFKPGFINQKMHERCSTCGLFYERHPGYFYVSMFVSYAITVAEMIAIGIATFVFSGGSENIYLYLGVIMVAMVLLSPFNFRFSRVLHMHFLDPKLRYQPGYAQTVPAEQEAPSMVK